MSGLDDLRPSFRTSDALKAGLSPRELTQLVAQGALEHVQQGRYRKAPAELTERNAARRALCDDLAVLGPEWHAALRSAALLHDIPLLGRLPAQPQLLRDAGASRTRGTDRFRRVGTLPEAHRTTFGGLRTVTAARYAVDIARTESFRSGLVVVDAVLGMGVPKAELEAVLATMSRWPGVRQAREVVALGDGLSESALESLSRLVLHRAAVPAPKLQVEIYLGEQYLLRTDKAWVERGVIGEDDGLAKFGDDAAGREQSFRLTKSTQDRLEAAGLVVVRWGWDDAFKHEQALVERVEGALRRGRPQDLDPRLRFVETTVEDRLARAVRFARRTA